MKKRKIWVTFMVTFSILLSSFGFYVYQVLYTPNILIGKSDRFFTIAQGMDFPGLQKVLLEDNVVQDGVSFGILARMMNYDKRIIAGKYHLKKDMTNLQLIRLLRSGNQVPVKITFNNIRKVSELGAKITKNTGLSEEAFNVELVKFVQENPFGFNENTVIAMFLPNTYEVYYTITAEDLIEKMHTEYKLYWNATRLKKATAMGLSPLEVTILASVVQAESRKKTEQPIIAGLYLNRIHGQIPLQADPTLVFAADDFTIKRVLNKHKEIDSPYNTYKNLGLPPGPINMPEIQAIEAVLDYQKHDYIYMCAKEDFSGYHNFASTLKAHNINARKYQKALSAEMRKAKK